MMTTANAISARIAAGLFVLFMAVSGDDAIARDQTGFSQAELDRILAPIALYPDTVLSHVLIAATYPRDVVDAARWSRRHPGYEGEYAVAAVEHYDWDPSVMALVAFPDLLARMDADLEWTYRIGDAFLVQEYQVLDTIQYLRDQAWAGGHLRSNEYVRVVREPEYIYIEPAVTRVVYVPYYDPYVVYASWRWASHPPVHWRHPRGYRYRSGTGLGFHWGSGHRVQSGFFFSSFHWSSHKVVVHDHYRYGNRKHGNHDRNRHNFSSGRDVARYDGARHWKRDADHRRGADHRNGAEPTRRLQAASRSDNRSASVRAQSRQRDRAGNRRALLQQRSRTNNAQAQVDRSRNAETGTRHKRSRQRSGERNHLDNGSRNSERRASRNDAAATRAALAAGSRGSRSSRGANQSADRAGSNDALRSRGRRTSRSSASPDDSASRSQAARSSPPRAERSGSPNRRASAGKRRASQQRDSAHAPDRSARRGASSRQGASPNRASPTGRNAKPDRASVLRSGRRDNR